MSPASDEATVTRERAGSLLLATARSRAARLRWLGAPASRLAWRIALGVLAVASFAGAVRLLPILLAPSVPPGLAGPLARGVLQVALETALFVAPPVAFALAAAASVERGEARALFALGARPLSLAAKALPAALAFALGAALAAFAWGTEARAPGKLARDLVNEARAACVASKPPAAADVPLVGISWVCLPGEAPRAIGASPLGGGVIAARAIEPSDDLRSVHAEDLEIVAPVALEVATGGEAAPRSVATLRARTATLTGIAPIARASNLGPLARALVVFASVLSLGSLGSLLVFAWGIEGRARSLALGIAGPAASLAALSTLERAPHAPFLYASVPILGVFATTLVAFAFRRLGRFDARRPDCSHPRRVVRVGSR